VALFGVPVTSRKLSAEAFARSRGAVLATLVAVSLVDLFVQPACNERFDLARPFFSDFGVSAASEIRR
jgi:hypothetical protein